jgi:signal transduction histidine kinase/DNA-binding response OmpR family regulator
MAVALSHGQPAGAQPTAAAAKSPTTAWDAPAFTAPEAGRLARRYVRPDAYGGHKQNWDATQDSSGVLYVANTNGVLAYDGHAWQSVPTANRSIARSIATGGQGRVYVGAQGDIGVLRRDAGGQLRHVSLLDHVPEGHRTFADVWRTEPTSDGVYFLSDRQLFRWSPATNTMRAWAADSVEYESGGAVGDSFYVGVPGEGLMTIADDELRPVPGGSVFIDKSVVFVIPHPRHGMVVGTYQGLFVRDGNTFRPLSPNGRSPLASDWVSRATTHPSGLIGVGTIGSGLFLFAPDGSLVRHLPARDKPVVGVYTDREGGLWALLDGGLLRYDLTAPFTEYGPSTGLAGAVEDVTRHRDTVYVATLEGTYRVRPAADSAAPVTASAVGTQSWALLSVGADLLVGTVNGLAVRRPNGTARRLFDADHVYDLLRSRRRDGQVYAGTGRGVRPVVRTDAGWQVGARVPGLQAKARSFAEAEDGTLWVGTAADGLYRVQFPPGADSSVVAHFGPEQGLPLGEITPVRWNGRVVFGSDEGLFRFRPGREPRFVPMDAVERPGGGSLARLTTDAQGRTWGMTNRKPGRWTRRDTTWHWTPGPLHRLRHRSVNVLRPEADGRILWIGTQQGLIRYVPGARREKPPPRTFVREIEHLGADTLLTADATAHPVTSVPFAQNSLRIAYGSPTFSTPDAVRYQYRRGGPGAPWSDWTSQTTRPLPDLAPGRHVFSVRARTAYGDTTAAARYAVTVRPPWYRTWWAYGAYVLLGLGLVGGAVQWRTRRLRRQQEQLEQAVADRTEEVRAQRNRLGRQAERLQELDEAKSRFFANISHEFRTPLTLIRGPVADVREHLEAGRLEAVSDAAADAAEQLAIAERNTARLQRLIEQILGLARLDAGTYEISARPTNLAENTRRIARRFAPMVERAGITLHVETDPLPTGEQTPVYVDPESWEHILSNLLSNAVKFTPEDGEVHVRVVETPDAVDVHVRDTGVGIPAAEQDSIFDRFRRADASATQRQEGTGIGLAFANDLVELHDGTIDIESAEGEGTTVSVRLPRGPGALSDDQLAAPRDASAEPVADDEAPTRSDPSLPASASPPSSSSSPAPSPQHPDGPSKGVLVVDDNADVRRYVRSILEPTFEVLEAANGEQGVAQAREHLPDVILADVMMPGVDGHEMTRRLKDDAETAAIPIIMLTARAATTDEVAGLQAGADDYVTKPFDAAVLEQRVGGVLTLQQRLRRRLEAELQEAPDGPTDASPAPEERPEIERRARAIVRRHLTDPDFGATDLAEDMAMSRSTLYRKLRAETEHTPSGLIRQVRLAKAKSLLRDGEQVTQVAYAVGYETLSSFSHVFAEEVGTPPSTYAAPDAST